MHPDGSFAAGHPAADRNGFKPRSAEVDYHGQQRTNATHASTTDPEAKLDPKSKGQEAKLSHMGHVLRGNRNGLIMAITATEANGTAERTATLEMLDDLKATHGRQPRTLGADKGFDDGEFFQTLEARTIEPHIPLVKTLRDPKTVPYKKQIPGVRARQRMKRRMQTEGDQLSQKCRRKVEEFFEWLKTIAGWDRCRTVGRCKLKPTMELGAAAWNLVRMRKLAPAM